MGSGPGGSHGFPPLRSHGTPPGTLGPDFITILLTFISLEVWRPEDGRKDVSVTWPGAISRRDTVLMPILYPCFSFLGARGPRVIMKSTSTKLVKPDKTQ